eukprot:TRINITY_DN934_c0_g1_i2.p1 TRINITY_DN934_c0_g1~~TRINITY_DN934_c0_g1_i2.p1  ORF type:complete len:167 (+),score=21.26 TRINITY_DN934_c0_g1_i2:431-931(+)
MKFSMHKKLFKNGHHGDDSKVHNKAKNFRSIVIGEFEMETWYFSPFPAEFNQNNTLYFCEFCLSFYGDDIELNEHMKKCILFHPPGTEIYRSEKGPTKVSMFEADGEIETEYCQNLCYLAKLFLDHKTLQFDTDVFLFYVLTEVDQLGCHLVGYFSKERFPAKITT